MYVYFAADCRAQIERHGLLNQIERLSVELEGLSLEQALSRFERVYPYLKRKEGNLRSIARIVRLGSEPVLCWLGVFRRGDRDYEEFLRDREDYIDPLELKHWLAQRQAAASAPPPARPFNPQLRLWLEQPSLRVDFQGVTIYESELWLERFAAPAWHDRWLALNRTIASLADAPQPLGATVPGWRLWLYSVDDLAILYSRLRAADTGREVLFLLAPFREPPAAAELVDVCKAIFGGGTAGWPGVRPWTSWRRLPAAPTLAICSPMKITGWRLNGPSRPTWRCRPRRNRFSTPSPPANLRCRCFSMARQVAANRRCSSTCLPTTATATCSSVAGAGAIGRARSCEPLRSSGAALR